jgi:hypothetical protein
VIAPRNPDEIVLLDGTISHFDRSESTRDDQGRVVCRGCSEYISSTLGCGCDPGELDDDGHPLDPRYAHLTVEGV